MLRPNDLAFNRFVIEKKAGAGGMGTVYLARDSTSGISVALKVIQIEDGLDEERFAREAAALAAVTHPGVVRYVAHGRGVEGHYLAMEWLEGEDLSTRLGRVGFTLAESVALTHRLATALAAAHARGVVHRDVKPRNVFLVDGQLERAKILDFGIARLFDAANVTMTGTMLGTPGYMSPEQAEGARDIDARADVFSLGCVLFRCLTGEPAFAGDNMLTILAKTVLEDAPRVSDLKPDVPPELDALVARLLAKDRRERPADGGAVAAELDALTPVPSSVAAPARSFSVALTEGEKRVLSVVVVGGASVRGEPTAAFGASRGKEAAVRHAAEVHGGRVESLADGSHLVTITGRAAATDLAAQAARCALALRELLPMMPIAIATGAGVFATQKSSRPVGALVARATAMLAVGDDTTLEEGAQGIRLDDATAGLLDVRFVVASDRGGLFLRAEREVVEGQRTLLGRPYPCVGRDREIAFVEGMIAECFADNLARVALVTGLAGRGKSRIRFELLRRLKERGARVTVFFARGDSVSAGSPFGMLAPAVRRAAGILDGEPPSITKKRLRARVSRHVRADLAPRMAEFLGEMAGVPASDVDSLALVEARRDAVLMGDAMESAFVGFLEAEASAGPVLFVLEDLHWGDLPTVRFIDAALRQLLGKPFCVLGFARPEVFTAFPGLFGDREAQELKIGALNPKASERLVREVLGEIDDASIDRIVARSGGNAFYLEELIRAEASGMPSADLPDTVLGMVQARLDAMGPEAKRVLRAASIFGQTFWRGGVVTLLGGDGHGAGVREWLDELVAREVIAAQGEGGIAGEAAFIFRHALLRDAAYAMLTDHDLLLGHQLAGSWLEAAGTSDAMTIAEHFRLGGAPTRALVWYQRAAVHALEGNDLAAAIDRAERAIDCGAPPTLFGALRLVVCEANKWRGSLGAAYDTGVEALRHLPSGGPLWFRAAGEVIAVSAQLTRADDLQSWTVEAIETEPVDGGMSFKIVALCRAVNGLLNVGRQAAADAVLDVVTTLAPNLGRVERLTAARVHQAWATRALHAGHFGAALHAHHAALVAFEEAGDLRNAALTRISVGVQLIGLGDYEAAEASLRLALRAADRMGLSNVEGWAHNNTGHVLLRRGKLREARTALERAADLGRTQGSKRLEIASRVYLAQLRLSEGEAMSAAREANAAAELARGLPLRMIALAVEARALLEIDGEKPHALACAAEAVALLGPLAGGEGENEVRLVHAEALHAVGEIEGARTAIVAASAWLLARAEAIGDDAMRDRFLSSVPENARILELARLWSADADGEELTDAS